MIDNTIKTDIKYLLMRVLFTLGSSFVVVIMSQAGNHDLKKPTVVVRSDFPKFTIKARAKQSSRSLSVHTLRNEYVFR